MAKTYKATQDSQKSGIGAKASFYADEAKYNPLDIPRDQRLLNSRKRNLDGEASSLIKGCIDEVRQRSLLKISPFNDKEGPSAPMSPLP